MPRKSHSEIERDRKALRALVSLAQSDMNKVFSTVPTSERIAGLSDGGVLWLYNHLRENWWKIADKYGTMAAALGQAQAEMMLSNLGYSVPKSGVPDGVPDPEYTASMVIDAMSQDDWRDALLKNLDGTIKTANTWSLCKTVDDSGAQLVWFPEGAKPCRYCLQRASHGAYSSFRSEAQARGFATKPHDGCDCRPVVIPMDGSFPEGFSPTTYSQQVAGIDREKAQRARDRADNGLATPGPKTRENVRRDASARAWGERNRIAHERDAAKKMLSRAQERGDVDAIQRANAVLDRTASERESLNHHH